MGKNGSTTHVLPQSLLEQLFLESSKSYLAWLINRGCCHVRNKKQGFSTCKCLSKISSERIEKLAQIQLNWFIETKNLRELQLVEWIKAAWDKRQCRRRKFKEGERKYEVASHSRWYGRKFVIAQFEELSNNGVIRYYPHFVCANALTAFYDIKYDHWKKLETSVANGCD